METGKEWNLTFIPSWFQCSKIINKTFLFCLSISVINTTSYMLLLLLVRIINRQDVEFDE